MITFEIKKYEEGTEQEFRVLHVNKNGEEIAQYQESQFEKGDWGINLGQSDNDKILLLLGWEDENIDYQESAREYEQDLIFLISQLI